MADPEGEGRQGKKVTIAIDESEYSHYALMWVLDNLKDSITGSPLIIFMAQPPAKTSYTWGSFIGSARMYYPVSTTPDFANNVPEQQNRLTLALLQKATDICGCRGVIAETLTNVGDPKEAICNAVQELNVNLLIIGERSLGKIRAFLGNISNYCFLNAKCPVLVAKKP